jgi:hypothetical protein
VHVNKISDLPHIIGGYSRNDPVNVRPVRYWISESFARSNVATDAGCRDRDWVKGTRAQRLRSQRRFHGRSWSRNEQSPLYRTFNDFLRKWRQSLQTWWTVDEWYCETENSTRAFRSSLAAFLPGPLKSSMKLVDAVSLDRQRSLADWQARNWIDSIVMEASSNYSVGTFMTPDVSEAVWIYIHAWVCIVIKIEH